MIPNCHNFDEPCCASALGHAKPLIPFLGDVSHISITFQLGLVSPVSSLTLNEAGCL